MTIGVTALVVARGEALALASSGYDMGDIKVMACFGVTEGEINGTPPVLWRLDISFQAKNGFLFLKGGSENFFRPRSEREQQKSFDRNKTPEKTQMS